MVVVSIQKSYYCFEVHIEVTGGLEGVDSR